MTKLHPLIDSWTLALESENKSPRTIEGYLESMRLFDRWLNQHHPDLMPDQITATHIRTWLVELAHTGRRPTVKTRWGGLKQFFTWCLTEAEIDTDPMGAM
ncbi:hypothetical protein GCM10027596_11630 [Nocardioides korecus]